MIYVGDPLGHQTGMARETCEVVQGQPSNLSDFVHSSYRRTLVESENSLALVRFFELLRF